MRDGPHGGRDVPALERVRAIVILLLVQAGGFGIMAGSTLLLLLLGGRRRVGLADRIAVQQTTGELRLGGVLGVVRNVALFAGREVVGAVVLAIAFLATGVATSPLQGIWWGVFHSVSAFNNAGFDIVGPDSLAPLRTDWAVLVPLAALVVVGSLGFAVVADVTGRARWGRLSVESRS
ncbi:MAG: potassium transporter TrkG [Chloroflexota bacterium]